ncbi:hypothetical protein DMC13_25165, partial [Escherichia coli]
ARGGLVEHEQAAGVGGHVLLDALARRGLERMRVVATKRKLRPPGGRALLVDRGDPALDDSFPDAIRVWAGYKEELLYPLGYAKDQAAPAGA